MVPWSPFVEYSGSGAHEDSNVLIAAAALPVRQMAHEVFINFLRSIVFFRKKSPFRDSEKHCVCCMARWIMLHFVLLWKEIGYRL